ncbi:glycosyl transferase [Candidatus Falkowbacteria bacterium CG10_big_fil_rev_8_21_14_0_10_39_9]|uniref:Glycosyl transferase n=1 Tax=Candidatus Falkowbacteria bacterium CG10_big_fil_rev_8_21_14_0_10_39_9 TaxID=1974566 RepID=A0A2M6WNQ2_9BACT|nr:MAG: glycosyl transferase [Candidatus Falkowbacteria bacterium CG10_big_fil_rev_8_21_14_0_10_39_9]
MENNYFSVIIPALNEELYIENCLKSLVNQDYLGQYEIIVVDNGSVDQTAVIAARYGAKVEREPEKGISNALIKGCTRASGNVLAFTDADTVIPENWLSQMNEIFNSNIDTVATGGTYLFYDKGFLPQVFFNKFINRFVLNIFKTIIYPRYPTLPCSNMAVRQEFYQKVGGFDTKSKWGQEIDLCKKLAKFGQVRFDKKLVVYTSFRRFSGEHNNEIIAFVRSVRELLVHVCRGLIVHLSNKPLQAQIEIRKKY